MINSCPYTYLVYFHSLPRDVLRYVNTQNLSGTAPVKKDTRLLNSQDPLPKESRTLILR